MTLGAKTDPSTLKPLFENKFSLLFFPNLTQKNTSNQPIRSFSGVVHPNEMRPHLPAVISSEVHRTSRRLLSVVDNKTSDQYFIDDAVKNTVDDLKNRFVG